MMIDPYLRHLIYLISFFVVGRSLYVGTVGLFILGAYTCVFVRVDTGHGCEDTFVSMM